MILCNPDYPISPEASKVNGFTNEQVKEYNLFPVEWAKIRHYFDGAILIGHNVDFDLRALNTEIERYHLQPLEYWSCDTCANARKLIVKRTGEDQVINHKLGTLCTYFNIELKNWHSADADTLSCMKLFNKLVELSDGDLEIK